MSTFKVSVVINQSIETIDKALMNPGNFPYWQKDLKKFEVIKGKPGEVGSVGLLHYLQNGKPYIIYGRQVNFL